MVKTNPLGINKISDIANNIRKEYLVSEDEFFPILDVLDDLFEKGALSYEIVENDYHLLDDNTPAIYVPYENFIYIKESVLEEYENKNYRSSFTLAHELFHYYQAQVLNFDFEEVDECKTYEDPEWQANEFAAQLLIPAKAYYLSNEEIVEKYHVSIECVLTRRVKNKKRETNKNK